MLQPQERVNVFRLCTQWEVLTCASVCPVVALTKTKDGPGVNDAEGGMGCRSCTMACPFEISKDQRDRPVPGIRKGILCAGRLKGGKPTAGAVASPSEAATLGKEEDPIWEAGTRICSKSGASVQDSGPGVSFFLLLACGTVTVIRFSLGLGAATDLSAWFPWGIWIELDLLCGVALAAFAFAVHPFCIFPAGPVAKPLEPGKRP